MATLIKNVRIIDLYAGFDLIDDVAISEDGIMVSPTNINYKKIINGRGFLLTPGLIDMHVHFREPGFVHKEDISSGIKAALGGGVTSVLVMPNTNPAIDQVKHVHYQMKRVGSFDLMVAASASLGLKGKESTSINTLARSGVKAITDDGHCVHDTSLLEKILRQCRLYNLVFMQHAEDKNISQGASLNDGLYSQKLGVLGQPVKAEWSVIDRDLKMAIAIGCRYHALHISCKESLMLIKKAKKISSLISCEVTPHHLLLNELDVRNKNPNAKMNPPLRSKEDVFALLQGLCDESIDVVASDHAPHSNREKKKGIDDAPFGVVGLESAMLVLLTLVKKQGLPLSKAIASMTTNPASILMSSGYIGTMIGEKAKKNAVLLDPEYRGVFLKRNLLGRSCNSPFLGMELFGKIKATFLGGNLVYGDNGIL